VPPTGWIDHGAQTLIVAKTQPFNDVLASRWKVGVLPSNDVTRLSGI
jgi:hypothetical protein